MWYHYRNANCGSTVDLSQLPQNPSVWSQGEEEFESAEEDLVPQMPTFHSYVSGPCTANCYPGANMGYPPSLNYPPQGYELMCPPPPRGGLQKSASCSFVPPYLYSRHPHSYPVDDSLEGSDVNSRDFSRTDDYSPDTDQKDLTSVSSKETDSKGKNKYSDSTLRPDSSLPPVIRRRNRNRRKQLAVSILGGRTGRGLMGQPVGGKILCFKDHYTRQSRWSH